MHCVNESVFLTLVQIEIATQRVPRALRGIFSNALCGSGIFGTLH